MRELQTFVFGSTPRGCEGRRSCFGISLTAQRDGRRLLRSMSDSLRSAPGQDVFPAVSRRRLLLKPFYRVRAELESLLTRLANFLEASPVLSFVLLLCVTVPGMLGNSLDKPLWHDELFTFYIAQAHTVAALVRDIQLIDLNPPLSYLATRLSYSIFGINTLSCRLPEMAGFLLAMLSLYLFVRRRAGTLYGLLAAGLLYAGAPGALAIEARPYGLLLGFSALSLLAWQRARERRSFALLLAITGCGLLLTHIFSVFVWVALAAAEALRVVQRRKVDWWLVAAWMAPLVCVVTYVPQLRAHNQAIFPAAYQPGVGTLFRFYNTWVEADARTVLLTGVVLLLVCGRRIFRGRLELYLTLPEWASVGFFFAIPLTVLLLLIRSHAAFFVRYATAGNIGLCVLAAVLLASWTTRDTRAALVCLSVAFAVSGQLGAATSALRHKAIFTHTEPKPAVCQACAISQKLDPTLPFVDASGLTFLEMDHREDAAMLRRVYYLTDAQASRQYAHASIFEGMQTEKELFPMRANVSTYSAFIKTHRRFFVLGDYDFPEDWLLRKLEADGATLRLLGETEGSYKDKDLYYVSF